MDTDDIVDIVDIVEDVELPASTQFTLSPTINEQEVYEEELDFVKGIITTKPTAPPVFWEPEPETSHQPNAEGEPSPENEPISEGEPTPENEPIGEGEPLGESEPGLYAEPEPPLFNDKEGLAVYSTLAAVIATLIIVLNIAVLIVLLRKPKQRKSLSWLLGLISTFDMIGGIQFLWFSSFDLHLMFTHANMWIIIMCGIWMLTMAPQISALIHFGLHWINELDVGVNNAKFTKGRILFISLTVFVLPIALFIPPVAGWNCIGCGVPRECAKECSMVIFPFPKDYVLLMAIVLFAAIALVISIYAFIYSKMSNKRREGKLSPKSGQDSLYRVTSAMVKVYILFTLPVAIVLCFDFAAVEENGALMNAFHATLFMSYLTNLFDPIIIFFTLQSMRDTKWERCCDSKCDKNKEIRMIEPPENESAGNNGFVDEKQLNESASAV